MGVVLGSMHFQNSVWVCVVCLLGRGAGYVQRPLHHLQGASVTLHTILLGVGGTMYNNHMLEPFKELGLDSQRAKKLLPSFI